jgi:hypothetical protein
MDDWDRYAKEKEKEKETRMRKETKKEMVTVLVAEGVLP